MVETERYAVVSCHVERPLDDGVWRLFSRLQERAPGGFRIAALMRPPDAEAGESAGRFVLRAREAAARGPLGHHTHFGGVAQARPTEDGAAERVRREGRFLREAGLAPTLFCGGGWYMEAEVAAAVAELGYADCTATAFRPPYLAQGAARFGLREPAWIALPGGRRLLELPTTHSLGMLARAMASPRRPRLPVVHAYFHDTDLADRGRRAALEAGLALLSRRCAPTDLDALAAAVRPSAPERAVASVAE